ncbi:MAG: MFS transporter, partial [Thermotogota bacterium]
MKNLTAYKALGFNTFLIMGAIHTYISAVMPVIRKTLSLTYSDIGVIYAANSIGFLTGAVITGLLIDFIGSKKPLLLSFFLFPIGTLLFAYAQGTVSLIAGNLIIGFSISVMQISIPPISGRFKGKSGSLLNLIHAFFAMGSMLSPFVASYFISRQLPYRAFFFVITGYICIPFFFSNILKIHISEKKREERKNALSGVGVTLKNKYFWLMCTAVFFYVGSEIGVFSWAPIYSTDKMNNSEELSSILPSMFWIGLLIGRFLS